MMFPKLPLLAVAVLAFTGIAFAGTPATETAVTADAAKHADKVRLKVAVGMSTAEVLQAIGKPDKIKPMKTEAVARAEIWVYSYSRVVRTNQVVTGWNQIPQVNPLTGVVTNINQPIYGFESVKVYEVTELLMVNDQLASSKRYRTSDRDYH